jgi:hypothetical protein
MSRNQDRLEVLASDLASRYGEHDELVRSVRMSIGARNDFCAPKPRLAASTPLKAVSTVATPRAHTSALHRQP